MKTKFAFVCIPAAENNNHPLQEQIASLLTIYFPLMLLRVKWVHGLCIIYYFLSRAYSSSSILKHTQSDVALCLESVGDQRGVLVLVRVKIPRAVASCPSSRLRQRSVKPSTSPKVNSWRAGLYIIAIFVSVKSDFRGKKKALATVDETFVKMLCMNYIRSCVSTIIHW